MKNKGTQQFNWSVTASEGKVWAKGRVTNIFTGKRSLHKSEGACAMSISMVDGADRVFDLPFN